MVLLHVPAIYYLFIYFYLFMSDVPSRHFSFYSAHIFWFSKLELL